jgi:hypothetical protein
MDLDFRQIVTIVALIVLIIALIIIGFSLRNTKDPKWPPLVPVCPDYWEINDSGKCVNNKSLGTCNKTSGNNTMDFTTNDYVGSIGPCKKYTWAKRCGVAWDGITYGAPNPCDITQITK